MLVFSITIAFIAIASIVSGQRLEVLENGKLCTNWQSTSGTDMTVSINTTPCSGKLNYELRMVANLYVVRFCCPYGNVPGPEVGPAPTGCGRQAVAPIRTRVVGGQEAAPHSWPWLVSLQSDGSHFCGGTIIDEYHIVTAAHCLQDSSTINSGFTIVAGLHSQSRPQSTGAQRREVAAVFNHEGYNDDSNENDVAVIRLAQPLQFNSYVNAACLPGKDPSLNDAVTIAGWGTTSYQGDSPDALRQAGIIVMDYCKYVYSYDNNKQLCAGNYQYSKDTCQGDSGGPLVYEVNGQWTLSGVVSYGDECAKQNRPGVYARVSYYLPWIRSKVASMQGK